MIKTLYFDVETTGLDPVKNGVIQLACIVDIGGEIKAEKEWFVRPFLNDIIDEKALEVNGLPLEKIKGFTDPKAVFRQFRQFLRRYISPYDSKDKFWPAGYNCTFDLNFMAEWFKKNGDKYFGSWQNWNAIDPLPIVRRLAWSGMIPMLENFKLGTVCRYFGIPLGDDAHDAMADIRATRELTIKLKGYFNEK